MYELKLYIQLIGGLVRYAVITVRKTTVQIRGSLVIYIFELLYIQGGNQLKVRGEYIPCLKYYQFLIKYTRVVMMMMMSITGMIMIQWEKKTNK